MTDYHEHKARDCRLRILQELIREPNDTMASPLLRDRLRNWAHDTTLPYLRRQLDHLAEIGAVRLTPSADPDIVIATLTPVGIDHLRRRTELPGVTALVDKGGG